MNYGYIIAGLLLFVAVVSGFWLFSSINSADDSLSQSYADFEDVKTLTDLADAGSGKDGFPAIDSPLFVSVTQANEWLADDDIVAVLEYKGVKRAYPLRILFWHEIVNDQVAGDPVLITYCPFCASAKAYDRTVDGETLVFGHSGKLLNANRVLYDKNSESYWTQLNGEAIIGPYRGMMLTPLSLQLVSWGRWSKVHPDAQVLSMDTGFNRPYSSNTYKEQLSGEVQVVPVPEMSDNSLAHNEIVIGFILNTEPVVYVQRMIGQGVSEVVRGSLVELRVALDGQITVFVDQKPVPFTQSFSSCWFAFYLDTFLAGTKTS